MEWDDIFSPHSELARPRAMAAHMVRDLLASRELAWRLFVRNISAAYRRTALGYLWAFLPPIFTTATFVFLQHQRIVDFGDTGLPYIAYVLIGTVLWQTFHDALNAPLRLASQSKVMLAKIHFPREALILAGIGESLFNFLIRLVVVIPVLLYYELFPGLGWLLAPLGVLSILLVGTVIGILLLPLGILYEDVEKGLPLIAGIWMFATPVFYPVPTEGAGRWLLYLNPVSAPLAQTRDWLAGTGANYISPFLGVAAAFLALALVGWTLYRIALPHVIARLPS